jgi:hypothetical protein
MTYDKWKTDPGDIEDHYMPDEITDEREELYTEIEKLRANNTELLAAAKAIYHAVHGDDVAVGPLWGRLHAAIAAAAEVAQ